MKHIKKLIQIQEDGIGVMSGAGAPIAQMGGSSKIQQVDLYPKTIKEPKEEIIESGMPSTMPEPVPEPEPDVIEPEIIPSTIPIMDQVQSSLGEKLASIRATYQHEPHNNSSLEESIILAKKLHLEVNPNKIPKIQGNEGATRSSSADEFKEGITRGNEGAEQSIRAHKALAQGKPIMENSEFGHVSTAHKNINKVTQQDKELKQQEKNNITKAANNASKDAHLGQPVGHNPKEGNKILLQKTVSDESIRRKLKYYNPKG